MSMEFLRETVIYQNSLWTWALFAAISIGAYIGLRIVRGFAIRRLASTVNRTSNVLDDSLIELLKRYTHPFFLAIFAILIGALVLDLPQPAESALHKVLFIALLLQAALWANGAVNHFLGRAMQKRTDVDPESASAYSFLALISRVVLWAIFLLAVLHNVGIDVTTLVAGLGVAGVAVALAVQSILGDLFASLSIVLDKPFVVGDFIAVDTLWGTVEHIGIKTTRVRSLSGEEIIFSNADLLRTRVHNYRDLTERRNVFTLRVPYDTPYEKLAAIPDVLREIVEAQEDVRFDRAHFTEYGDFSLIFEVVFYVTSPDYITYMDRRQAINLEIYQRFAEDGVEFALPTRTLYLNRASSAASATTAALEAGAEPGQSPRPEPGSEPDLSGS